ISAPEFLCNCLALRLTLTVYNPLLPAPLQPLCPSLTHEQRCVLKLATLTPRHKVPRVRPYCACPYVCCVTHKHTRLKFHLSQRRQCCCQHHNRASEQPQVLH